LVRVSLGFGSILPEFLPFSSFHRKPFTSSASYSTQVPHPAVPETK
jgi:hypothetical protein